MKWFSKPRPVSNEWPPAVSAEGVTETIPTLVMKGSSVIEVGFTKWQSEDGIAWSMGESPSIHVEGEGDRLVFELPVGCFEMPIYVWDGTVSFTPAPGTTPISRCRRPLAEMVHESNEVVSA